MKSRFNGEAARPRHGNVVRLGQSHENSGIPRSQRLLLSGTGLVALLGLGALAALFTAPFADPIATASDIRASAMPAAIAAGINDQNGAASARPQPAASAPRLEPGRASAGVAVAIAVEPEAEMLPADDPRWAKAQAVDHGPVTTPAMVPSRRSGSPDDTQTAAIPDAGSIVEAAKPETNEEPAERAGGSRAAPSITATVTSAVKMRARPANGAGVVAVVPDNASVGLVGCQAWCEVVYKGSRGFIYKRFIDGSSASPAQPKAAANEQRKPKIRKPSRVDLNSVGR